LIFIEIQVGRYGCKVLYEDGDFVFLLDKFLGVERDEGVGRRGILKKARGGCESNG
jgi:hypothetical protein